MNRAIDKLIRTLERMSALYGELLACAREKTSQLVSCDVAAIEASQGREAMVIGKLAELERSRDAILAEAAEAVGCTQTPPTVSAIALALGTGEEADEARTKLTGLRDQLRGLARDTAVASRLNEQLCTQSLTHLEVFMGLLTGRSAKQSVYTSQGKTRMYEARALVSRSA